MKTCRLIVDNAIFDSVSDPDTGRTSQKIWPRLDKERTVNMLKQHKTMLTMVVEIIMLHCIMVTHARGIGLGVLLLI